MNSKKLFKILGTAAILTLVGSASAFATEEPVVSADQIDNVPPVFASNIQTTYIVKKTDDGSKFDPQSIIKGITATDDVDGSNVDISIVENNVELSLDGEYQVVYSATDKAGNESYLVITVFVDGIAPTFDENIESEYHINQTGIILDSKDNIVEALPKTLVAKDSLGAFKGIGIAMTLDENGNIVVFSTLENTPAQGELQVNDILIGVDGEDLRGQTPEYASTKIKGEEGTDVGIKILRNNQEIIKVFKRALIKVYEDEEIIAEPNIEVEAIDVKNSGTIEITYSATDKAGNKSEFVIKVVIEEKDPVLNEDCEVSDDEKPMYMVTTGDTPPEGLDITLPKAEDEENKNVINEQEEPISNEEKTEETKQDNKEEKIEEDDLDVNVEDASNPEIKDVDQTEEINQNVEE